MASVPERHDRSRTRERGPGPVRRQGRQDPLGVAAAALPGAGGRAVAGRAASATRSSTSSPSWGSPRRE
jgi:hypothetical protein